MEKDSVKTEPSDIVDIYIQVTKFIRNYYKIIFFFLFSGVLFGWIYFTFTTPQYNTTFLIKNGNLDNPTIKGVMFLSNTNFTDLSNEEFNEILTKLKPLEKVNADTSYMNGTILFRIKYIGTIDLNDTQNSILLLFKHSNIVIDYIKRKKNELTQQKKELLEFIDLFKNVISNTDTINQKIRFKILNENLSGLLKQKSEIDSQLKQTGDFSILTPILKPESPLFTFKSSILFSTIIFFILGITCGVIIDLNKRAKERNKDQQ